MTIAHQHVDVSNIVEGTISSQAYRWDSGTLSWVPWDGVLAAGLITIGVVNQGSPGLQAWKVDASGVTVPISAATLPKLNLLPASGLVNASGNNVLITPSLGKKLRLSYVSYNPASEVEAAFRFGVAGMLFLRNNLTVGGSIIAKDFGDLRYLEGGIDEALILNLSVGVATIWNAFYVEV